MTDTRCTCIPCESPQYGAPGIAHCAACCMGSGIEEYSHTCIHPEHRAWAEKQNPTQAQAEAARYASRAPDPVTPADALGLLRLDTSADRGPVRAEAAYRLLRHVRAEAARADHASDLAEAWAHYRERWAQFATIDRLLADRRAA